ncbi:tetratricopeptide repeat protein [Microbulbifer epialgicus]|uniref:Tetratricopeptide repeat protein n=1 Tax=Microbulbifer epialgicus TaxID=393907 RepID=A0ABV4P3W5_9GAMM
MKARVFSLIFVLFLPTLSSSAYCRDWHEFKSENFTVYSDVSAKKAKDLLLDLEKFRRASLLLTGLENRAENSRLRVYHFNKSKVFDEFSGTRRVAGFYTNTINGPLIFSQENNRGIFKGEEIMFHEYVHHLMRERGGMRYPKWYSEGFAELLASAVIKKDSIVIGNLPKWRLYALQEGPLKAEQIIKLDTTKKGGKYNDRYYASAWLLLHYLFFSEDSRKNSYNQATKEYLAKINEGGNALKEFPLHYNIELKELDAALVRYLRERRLSGYEVKLTINDIKVSKRKLSKNEELLLLAERAVDLEKYDLALRYLERAESKSTSSHAIDSLKANLLFYKKDYDSASTLIEGLLGIDEIDYRVATNLAIYYLNRLEGNLESNHWDDDSYSKILDYADIAIKLNPNSLSAYQLKWMAQQRKDSTIDALKTMMAAYQQNPNSIEINSSIGFFLAELKKPKLAKPFLERTLAWSHDKKVRAQAKKLLKWIENDSVIAAESTAKKSA